MEHHPPPPPPPPLPPPPLPRDSSLTSDDAKYLQHVSTLNHDLFSPTSTASSEQDETSDSDSYYRDVRDVVRDSTVWPAPVDRACAQPTYDSGEEAFAHDLDIIDLSEEDDDRVSVQQFEQSVGVVDVVNAVNVHQLAVVELSDGQPRGRNVVDNETPSPRIEKAAYAEAEEALATEAQQRKEAEQEARQLLDGGGKHRRDFSDWAIAADDALSLEELQFEADQVSEAIEQKYEQGLLRVGRPRTCPTATGMRKRAEGAVNELAEMQMITAGIAANAEQRLGSEKDVLRAEVCRLRIMLDHVVKLMLEEAYEIRDCAERHR